MPLLPLKTFLSTDLMSAMHLQKPRPQSKASTSSPTARSTNGGNGTRLDLPSCQAMSFQCFPQCKATQNPRRLWEKMPILFSEISNSHLRSMNLAYTQVLSTVNMWFSNNRSMTLPLLLLINARPISYSTCWTTSSPCPSNTRDSSTCLMALMSSRLETISKLTATVILWNVAKYILIPGSTKSLWLRTGQHPYQWTLHGSKSQCCNWTYQP